MTVKTPTAIRLLQGNPARRPLNENEPEYETLSEIPPAPNYLLPHQAEFWAEMVRILMKGKVMTEADVPAVAMLCVAMGDFKKANTEAEKIPLIKTPSGYVQQSPWVGTKNTAMKHIRAMLNDLGMTPAGRSRVQVVIGARKENPFSAYLANAKKA